LPLNSSSIQIYIFPSHSNANALRNCLFRGCASALNARKLPRFSNNHGCVGRFK